MQSKYWKFFWPLALMGILMMLGRQFENLVLAKYPDAVRELATFAVAGSLFGLFNAILIFVPQMANVLARGRQSHRVCLRFTLAVAAGLTALVAALSFAPQGPGIVGRLFQTDLPTARVITRFLRLLLPLIAINALRQYYVGLLIQAHRTKTVTLLNMVHLAVLIAVLLGGLAIGQPAVLTLAAARLLACGLHLAVALAFYRAAHVFPADGPAEADGALTTRAVTAFFWPVAMTSVMFALSRPVIYAFVNRTDGAAVTVAALRVAFDFVMLFHSPLNQFRHLFVTFGRKDPEGVKRFMVRVMLGVWAALALTAFTPLGTVIFRDLIKVPPETLDPTRKVFMTLAVWPLLITFRNYYHGQLLTRRRTAGMAAGSVARLGSIAAVSAVCEAMGWLDHITAGLALQVGFLAEGLISAAFARRHIRTEAVGAGW